MAEIILHVYKSWIYQRHEETKIHLSAKSRRVLYRRCASKSCRAINTLLCDRYSPNFIYAIVFFIPFKMTNHLDKYKKNMQNTKGTLYLKLASFLNNCLSHKKGGIKLKPFKSKCLLVT